MKTERSWEPGRVGETGRGVGKGGEIAGEGTGEEGEGLGSAGYEGRAKVGEKDGVEGKEEAKRMGMVMVMGRAHGGGSGEPHSLT